MFGRRDRKILAARRTNQIAGFDTFSEVMYYFEYGATSALVFFSSGVFLTVRGLGLCDIIPLSTHVTSLFEFPDRYLCIQQGYAKHPNLFPEGPHKGGVTYL